MAREMLQKCSAHEEGDIWDFVSGSGSSCGRGLSEEGEDDGQQSGVCGWGERRRQSVLWLGLKSQYDIRSTTPPTPTTHRRCGLRDVHPTKTYQDILYPVRNLFKCPNVRASTSLSFAFHLACLIAHRLPSLLDDSHSAS